MNNNKITFTLSLSIVVVIFVVASNEFQQVEGTGDLYDVGSLVFSEYPSRRLTKAETLHQLEYACTLSPTDALEFNTLNMAKQIIELCQPSYARCSPEAFNAYLEFISQYLQPRLNSTLEYRTSNAYDCVSQCKIDQAQFCVVKFTERVDSGLAQLSAEELASVGLLNAHLGIPHGLYEDENVHFINGILGFMDAQLKSIPKKVRKLEKPEGKLAFEFAYYSSVVRTCESLDERISSLRVEYEVMIALFRVPAKLRRLFRAQEQCQRILANQASCVQMAYNEALERCSSAHSAMCCIRID